jgi:hypothetical protein
MLKKTQRRHRILSLTFLTASLATLLFTTALANITIEFEGLTTNGVPGKLVTTDFANHGVTFAPVWATDFSSIAPDFAHSGVMALAPCAGIWAENCVAPLEMSFCHDQAEVAIWVGYTGQLSTGLHVIMRGFDINGVEKATNEITLGPSTGPIAIRKHLVAQAAGPKIRRVTVGFKEAEGNTPTAYNLGLAIDDVWFDDQTPCSVACPVGQAPAFSLNLPTNDQIFIHNTLTVSGSLPAANPDATFRIAVTGPQGQARSYGPYPVSPGEILFPNLGDLLFPGSNSLVFTVTDCAGSYSVQRTVNFRSDITKTRFMVVDEKGFAVGGAEIYADGNLKGRTDTSGTLIVEPTIPVGTKVIARKMVYESATDRAYHKDGSYQNWKGRWYISNLAVNNDGNLAMDVVTIPSDPLGYQIIRVLKRNTLVGLNLVVSFEWDASAAELETWKQELIKASYRLYNATDGQVMIERVKMADDGTYWVDTDVRVLADRYYGAKSKRSAFFNTSSSWPCSDIPHWPCANPHVRLSRGSLTSDDTAKVLVHELGHYLFGVRDEYEGKFWGDSYCTAKLKSAEPPYEPDSEYAACVMNTHWNTNKFCSLLPENSHRIGTEQGIASCWQNILAAFSDSNSNKRWVLQSPDTRGVIVGQINHGSLPLPAWAPNVTVENRGKPSLCAEKLFRVVASDGTPIRGHEMDLTDLFRTWSINEGVTDANGEIIITGMHLGDRVDGNQVSTCTLTAQKMDPLPNDRLQLMPASYSVPPAELQPLAEQVIVGESRGPHIFTELRPSKRNEAEISVYGQTLSGRPLTIDRPIVKVWSRDFRDALNIATKYIESRAAFVGTLHGLPSDGRVQIAVTATICGGGTETASGWFQLSGNDPEDDTEVYSANGQLGLLIPQNALPRGAMVAIGPGTMRQRDLPAGYEVVSGPYAIWWSTNNYLPGSGAVKFELSRNPGQSAMAGYIRETFRIMYYNADMGSWEDIGGTIHPAPFDIVSQLTNRMGNYVLIARRSPVNTNARQGNF